MILEIQEGPPKDWGTNCVDCARYKTLGEVCVIEHGKKFLWEFCRDFQAEVKLPEYDELMRTVKKEMAIERKKVRQKKKRERTLRQKELEENRKSKKKAKRAALKEKMAKRTELKPSGKIQLTIPAVRKKIAAASKLRQAMNERAISSPDTKSMRKSDLRRVEITPKPSKSLPKLRRAVDSPKSLGDEEGMALEAPAKRQKSALKRHGRSKSPKTEHPVLETQSTLRV